MGGRNISVNLWSELKKLQGKTLFTLGQRKTFEVAEVSRSYVVLTTSKGSTRPVPLRKFERAWAHLEKHKILTLVEIRSLGYSNFHPTYIAAVIANIPGVSFRTKPISLRFNK